VIEEADGGTWGLCRRCEAATWSMLRFRVFEDGADKELR
jgi:hypothetical protein